MQKIGEEWITDLSKLRRLEKFVKDKNFKHAFMRSKQVINRNKRLYRCIAQNNTGEVILTSSFNSGRQMGKHCQGNGLETTCTDNKSSWRSGKGLITGLLNCNVAPPPLPCVSP